MKIFCAILALIMPVISFVLLKKWNWAIAMFVFEAVALAMLLSLFLLPIGIVLIAINRIASVVICLSHSDKTKQQKFRE